MHDHDLRTRFNLIEMLNNANINKDLSTILLRKRENSWTLKSKTLHSNGLSAERTKFSQQIITTLYICLFVSHIIFSANRAQTLLDKNFKIGGAN